MGARKLSKMLEAKKAGLTLAELFKGEPTPVDRELAVLRAEVALLKDRISVLEDLGGKLRGVR